MVTTKRRQRGDGGLYQRKDGLWVGVVDLPAGPDGSRRRRTVSSRSYGEAVRRLRTLRREVEEHGDVLASALTVGQWLTYWLDEIAPGRVRPSTLYGYRGYVERYLAPQLGHLRLARLTAAHVRGMLRSMDALSPATRRQAFAVLSRALTVAVREQKLRVNPCTLMDAPPSGKVHRLPFTLAQARAVIASLDVERDPAAAARWLCALLQGLRQGEALGLRWEDVDLDARTITVRAAIQRRVGVGLVLVPPKSARSMRTIPMLEPVRLALSRMPSREGYVWGGERPRDPRADWQAWRDMLERAGAPHRPLHAARTTTGSLLDAAGVSPKVISEILGHAQVSTTQEVYIHGDAGRHLEAMGALDRLLGP